MLDGSASTTERNIITVLAVDMVGSTRHIASCDLDDAQAFLDQWFEHARSAVERAGGLIVHYADELDLKMAMSARALQRDMGPGPFTERDPALGRALLKTRGV